MDASRATRLISLCRPGSSSSPAGGLSLVWTGITLRQYSKTDVRAFLASAGLFPPPLLNSFVAMPSKPSSFDYQGYQLMRYPCGAFAILKDGQLVAWASDDIAATRWVQETLNMRSGNRWPAHHPGHG